jgi:hypothetical protein
MTLKTNFETFSWTTASAILFIRIAYNTLSMVLIRNSDALTSGYFLLVV